MSMLSIWKHVYQYNHSESEITTVACLRLGACHKKDQYVFWLPNRMLMNFISFQIIYIAVTSFLAIENLLIEGIKLSK